MSEAPDEFSKALAPPAATLRRWRVREAAKKGARRAATVLLFGSLVVAVSSAAVAVTQVSTRLSLTLVALVALAGLFAFLKPLIREMRSVESLRHIAQRVDVALQNHNSVSTALELRAKENVSPFEGLAIEQGLSQLSRVDATTIHIDPASPLGRRPPLELMGAIAITALAFTVVRPLSVSLSEGSADAGLSQALAVRFDESSTEQKRKPESSNSNAYEGQSPANRQDQGSGGEAAPATKADNQSGASSSDASAKAGAASLSSESTAGGSTPRELEKRPSENNAETPEAKAADAVAKSLSASSDAAQDSANSGTGSAANASGSNSKGASADSPDEKSSPSMPNPPGQDPATGDEPSAEEKQSESAYQTAAQPLRQDRSPPITRELGQSGTSGETGSGRGGPGETKKTRGVGAVFLSVPVPDYLIGKMSAGLSRITRRWIPPQRQSLAPPAPAAVTAGDGENVIRRFDIPLTDAAGVSKFLDALHQEEITPSAPDAAQTKREERP